MQRELDPRVGHGTHEYRKLPNPFRLLLIFSLSCVLMDD